MTCRHCASPGHDIAHCPDVTAAFGPLKVKAVKLTCRHCGEKFLPTHHSQKHCSRRCYDAGRNGTRSRR